MHCILFVILLTLSCFSLYSQNEFPETVDPRDSVQYSYHFVKGDTLLYEALSRDSIIIDTKKPPLLKERRERFLLSCDSVNSNGIMYLSYRLLDFKSSEYSGISQLIEREDHNWKSRKIWIAIDSTGKRHGYGAEDSTIAALSPGGPFQPIFLQQLGNGFHAINSGWIVEDTIDTPENAIPAPMLRYLSSMRARKSVDTLNETCLRCESTISAQGGFFTKSGSMTPTVTMKNNSIIAGFGIMHLSQRLGIPIHFYGTSENKSTVKISTEKGNSEQSVKHYILTNITLQKMVSKRGNYTLNKVSEKLQLLNPSKNKSKTKLKK